MKVVSCVFLLLFFSSSYLAQCQVSMKNFEKDRFTTDVGDLVITSVGHGSLMIESGGKVIHIDPVMREADYAKMPKADFILVTHEHGDHLDLKAIDFIKTPSTKIVVSKVVTTVEDGLVLKNGESVTFGDLSIQAVPAYNLVHLRPDGVPFHAKGDGNGYVLTIGGKRIYIAGDTENIPEMAQLKNIDIAFLPMNLPYTMTPEMVAEGARMFMPKILYPYHYGDTNPDVLVDLLKGSGIEVRIRQLK